MSDDFLSTILRQKQTVFSHKDLSFLFRHLSEKDLNSRIYYYLKTHDLYRIRRGLYAKDNNYDKYELATKIYTPSYISFETVLFSEGVIFQYYSQIFVATYQSRELICDNQQYVFKKMKSEILNNPLGVEVKEFYSIASLERAFLDTVYINKEYHFDNLNFLNWEKVYELVSLYENISMKKRVDKYYRNFQRSLNA